MAVSHLSPRFLEGTGQYWKLVFPLVVLALSGITVLGRELLDPWLGGIASQRLLFASTAAGLVAWGLLLFGIHCPSCATNLLWRAVRRQGADWLVWLLDLRSCPECGRGCGMRP